MDRQVGSVHVVHHHKAYIPPILWFPPMQPVEARQVSPRVLTDVLEVVGQDLEQELCLSFREGLDDELHVIAEEEERAALPGRPHDPQRVTTIRLRVAQSHHVVSRVDVEDGAQAAEDSRSVVLELERRALVRRCYAAPPRRKLELHRLVEGFELRLVLLRDAMVVHPHVHPNPQLQPAGHLPCDMPFPVDYLSNFVQFVNFHVLSLPQPALPAL
mmetsp:Transcript_40007/g.125672  ORF Transcript_40007/g.125672 Transcript_40007/m.125672 type:complete len:215 (-) Transcript_40007:864-1508(-)